VAYLNERDKFWKIDHPHEQTTGITTGLLKSEGLTVKIDFFRDKEKRYFYITTKFIEVKEPLEYKPSLITLKLPNGNVLYGKALSCYNKNWDFESLRLYPSVQEPIKIEKEERYHMVGKPCYALFFDCPPPPVKDDIIMFINKAIVLKDGELYIPPIYFRKKVDYDIRLGLTG
jgi:hypothetical protein